MTAQKFWKQQPGFGCLPVGQQQQAGNQPHVTSKRFNGAIDLWHLGQYSTAAVRGQGTGY